MKVFLVRHGDADADIPDGLTDDARALTIKGRHTVAAHFKALGDRVGRPDWVLCSPLVRAVQTATLLTTAIGYEGPVRAHRSLLPDGPVGALDTLLEAHEGETLVLVGHQPSMGAMAAHLLGLQAFPRAVYPGTVIGIERSDGQGENRVGKFVFYATPGQPVLERI